MLEFLRMVLVSCKCVYTEQENSRNKSLHLHLV